MDSTILILEDEREIRELIAVNLQRAGFRALDAFGPIRVTEAASTGGR